MSVTDSLSDAGRSWRLSPRNLAIIGFGLVGALAVGIALTGDFFGGTPGFGRTEQLALVKGLVFLGIATVLKYSVEGGLIGALKFLAVSAQLGLALYILDLYAIEGAVFHEFVFPVVVAGFLGFHFLPRTVRPHAFLLLSLAVMFGALGLSGGIVLLTLGLVLVGICHLPVSWGIRIALILAMGGFLALVRLGTVPLEPVEAILPILASIFMFRLVIYIYDVRNGSGPKDWASRLSYFFMLPNFVFPFFPVVDFTQWGRSQDHDDSIDVYQRGAMWIFYGIVHLLLYRAVNYYMAFDHASVENFGAFLYYVVTNYALYLKISGLFHMILGCLFMFGYALPETHGRYYLSNSFVELWRRVNIYWKDFMQKLVFNPAYMVFKKRGLSHIGAVSASIVLVFFVTWWTHAYQWFWLVGSWLLTVPDTLFWGLLGLFLIVQTVENARPPQPGARALIGPRTLLAIQTISMMTLLMILWSLWSCQTLGEWLDLLERGGLKILGPVETWTAMGVLQSIFILAFFFVIVAFSIGYTLGLAPKGSHPRQSALGKKPPFRFGQSAMQVTSALVLIALVQSPAVLDRMPRDMQLTALDMRLSRLSTREQSELETGYYENLTTTKAGGTALASAGTTRPRNWERIRDSQAVRMVDDYLEYELIPDRVTIFKAALLSTNHAGMRDQNYAMKKPDGTLRIALIGASRAMGAGVNDDEVFESLTETALSEKTGQPVEILNFAVADYEPVRRLMTLERRLAEWAPDVVMYIAHSGDADVRHLAAKYKAGVPRPYPWLDAALDTAGVTPDMSYDEIHDALEPLGTAILTEVYNAFTAETRAMGAEPLWVYLPSTKPWAGPEAVAADVRGLARQAGFSIVNLEDLYAGQQVERFWLRPWDRHPNAQGHAYIAQVLTDALMQPEIAARIGLNQ